MTPEQAAQLRAEFAPATIGKLPKVNCKACVDANKKQFGTTCGKHEKKKCQVCENWITTAHIHLDYVGHAAATDRLLQVDPEWTWEPYATDQYGMPLVSGDGLWIKLTIAGVTRPGYGDGKNIKEMIGDAIRNAAMRFGVGLDLWAKEDLHASENAEAGQIDASVAPAADRGVTPAPASAVSQAEAFIRRETMEADEVDDEWHPPAVELHDALALSRSLITRKVSVADARKADGLPPLNEKCDEPSFRLWQKLLHDLDVANPVEVNA